MHDFGYGGSVDQALPEGAETLTRQMTNDDLSKIGFPSPQLLPGECAEFPEVPVFMNSEGATSSVGGPPSASCRLIEAP